MKTTLVAALALAGAGTAAGLAAAQASSPSQPAVWLHVRVEEPRKQSRVSVNLPMPVVEAVLKAAPERIASHGKIHLGAGGKQITIAELREVWKELRKSGDADIVTIEEKDERVSVAKRGDLVRIRVHDPRNQEKVSVDVPVALVDALLSGQGDDLDVRAGVAELRKLRGEIVHVTDKDSTVRVWIDQQAPAADGSR